VRFKLDQWLLSHQSVPFPKGAPPRLALISMLDHFLQTNPVESLHRLGVARGRWRKLATLLDSIYDLGPWGGRAWLFSKSHFGAYAVTRVWAVIQASNLLTLREKAKLKMTIKIEVGRNLTAEVIPNKI